jgi:hypothetical protein
VSARLAGLGACGLVSALVASGAASAHISATPGLLVVDETQTVRLLVHNDLDRPMTGLVVVAPSGLRIVGADTDRAWESVLENNTVRWTGGPLAPNTGNAFALDVSVDEATPPGPVQLQAEQLYPGGGKLPWPVSLTVVPADDDTPLLMWAVVSGLLVLATGAIVAVAVLRRDRTLQER